MGDVVKSPTSPVEEVGVGIYIVTFFNVIMVSIIS